MHRPDRLTPSLQQLSLISSSQNSGQRVVSIALGTPVTEQSDDMTPPCTPPTYHVGKAPADTNDRESTAIPIPPKLANKDVQGNSETTVAPTAGETLAWAKLSPQLYTKNYQLSGSTSLGYDELGHGAWSTVYRATETPETPLSTLLTPPSSPVSLLAKPATGRVLAIKTPSRKEAHDILHHEARILTYLHCTRHTSDYVVPFHGYDATSKSVVMDAIPWNLEAHAKSCLENTRANFSTRTMFDPVCESQEWKSLAMKLINGLVFLHSNGCIHGDIKPSNILLHRSEKGSSAAYTPLYCDFSSSRILNGSNASNTAQVQQVTALTPDYASPELLTSLHGTAAIATAAADVYALGVTLVVAAIGESPFAGASMEAMKLSMVREGKVLEFARQADQGTRIMKGKIVDRCLKDALEKDMEKRVTAKQWQASVNTILEA
ncbi:MAG: hypothetical protein LQ337_006481 [Flavoplaca oasis]|nr:MAG: hypothetical protein LQ337_006481 [Flavoplaca oasis]